MGNCNAAGSAAPISAEAAAVEQQLLDMQAQELLNPKILLLGAGESGKSTVVKQIKLIWKVGGGLTDRDKEDVTQAIRKNAIEAIQVILEANRTLEVPLANASLQSSMDEISAVAGDDSLTPAMADKIEALWNDPGIQTVFSRRDEFWNLDATPYYLNEVVRLAQDEYEPTDDDIVMARVRTTGIVLTQVPDPPYNYQVVDVGGQRSERRKWIHCFDNVNAIIFLEGLSGYNQVLFEDNSVNRMHESLNLFDEVLKNPLFKDTPVFLFLNKKDLFEEMIPKYPLSKCFPDYEGPAGEMKPALDFIQEKFLEIGKKRCPGKKIYIHVIAARLRMDMKVAFGEVKEELKAITARNQKKK